MKKTSNTKPQAKAVTTQKVETPEIAQAFSLVTVEANAQVMLRDGSVILAGSTFETDTIYAELLKKTYGFKIIS